MWSLGAERLSLSMLSSCHSTNRTDNRKESVLSVLTGMLGNFSYSSPCVRTFQVLFLGHPKGCEKCGPFPQVVLGFGLREGAAGRRPGICLGLSAGKAVS